MSTEIILLGVQWCYWYFWEVVSVNVKVMIPASCWLHHLFLLILWLCSLVNIASAIFNQYFYQWYLHINVSPVYHCVTNILMNQQCTNVLPAYPSTIPYDLIQLLCLRVLVRTCQQGIKLSCNRLSVCLFSFVTISEIGQVIFGYKPLSVYVYHGL